MVELNKEISFIYRDTKGEVTRRSLFNYKVEKSPTNHKLYLVGQDNIRDGAVRKFLRSSIIAISKVDNEKEFCYGCDGHYKDNKPYRLNDCMNVTFCDVCVNKAALKGVKIQKL